MGLGSRRSGVVFGSAHMQLTLFFPLFALGFGLAWVYKQTGSLWTSIALHAIFNAISVVAWALTRLGGLAEQRRLPQVAAAAAVCSGSAARASSRIRPMSVSVVGEDALELVVFPVAHDALAVVHDEVDARVAGADVARQPDLGREALADDVAHGLQHAHLGRRLEARALGDDVGAARKQAPLRRKAARGVSKRLARRRRRRRRA